MQGQCIHLWIACTVRSSFPRHVWTLQTKDEQMSELEHALMSAADALEQRQAALVECQDLLAEMLSRVW